MMTPRKSLAVLFAPFLATTACSSGGSSTDPASNPGGGNPGDGPDGQVTLDLVIDHGTLTSTFPDKLNPSDDVVVSRDGKGLKFGVRQVRYVDPLGRTVAQSQLRKSEATRGSDNVIYRGVSGVADLVYKIKQGSVEQLLMLNERPTLPLASDESPEGAKTLELVEQVDFSGFEVWTGGAMLELPARTAVSGAIELRSEGRVWFTIPEPEVRDASASRARQKVGFQLNLSGEGKGVLATIVPMAYLLDAERQYPVAIDPSVEGHACDVDAHCNDRNPCTQEACVAGGCEYQANTAAHGQSCWTTGVCETDPVPAGAASPADYCVFTVGDDILSDCTVGGPTVCRDGNPCTTDVCNPTTKECENEVNAGAVGDVCYDTGICNALGECEQQDVPCVPSGPEANPAQACKTGNQCLREFCACDNPPECTIGHCEEELIPPMFDGIQCLGNGVCDGGVCLVPDTGGACGGPANGAVACNDGNPCTVDSCDDKGTADTDDDECVNSPCMGGDCEGPAGRDACYETGLCMGSGDCYFCGAPGQDPDICDDSNPCTVDSCMSGECDHDSGPTEGSPCLNGGICSAGLCVIPGSDACGGPQACNDGNPCTTDSCSAEGVCEHVSIADDTQCWGTGSCQAGQCVFNPLTSCSTVGGFGGGPDSCDDGNPCTDDNCEPDGSCSHTPVNIGGMCWESGTCTPSGVCTF